MSSIGSPLLVNANPLPFNHVPCPTCVDHVIDESEVAGCGNCIFCQCCDFACPECQCQWDKMEELVEHYMETDLVQLRLDEDAITPGQGRNLIYKFLVKTFCGSLGRGIRMELPDCCLKGVRSLLKNKDPKEKYTGYQPVSKRIKRSSK